MASVPPISSPAPAGNPPPQNRVYHVTTRELSADLSSVGPHLGSRDLGAIDAAQFLGLLEKLVAIDTLMLVEGDPQLFVTVKSGRFLIQPQGGKLLVRPTNALDLIFFKLSPAEIPPFLDGMPASPPPPSSPSTLIGSAVARAEAGPPPPPPAPAPAPPPEKKSRRPLVLGALVGSVIVAGGLTWFFFLRAPSSQPPAAAVANTPPPTHTPAPTSTSTPTSAPAPAVPAPEFDPIASPEQLAELKQRVVGNYATPGDVAERLLGLREDGTFRYQEFGANLAASKSESGAYTIELRRGTQTPVIRAAALGVIEIRDANTLIVRGVVFTRFTVPQD